MSCTAGDGTGRWTGREEAVAWAVLSTVVRVLLVLVSAVLGVTSPDLVSKPVCPGKLMSAEQNVAFASYSSFHGILPSSARRGFWFGRECRTCLLLHRPLSRVLEVHSEKACAETLGMYADLMELFQEI